MQLLQSHLFEILTSKAIQNFPFLCPQLLEKLEMRVLCVCVCARVHECVCACAWVCPAAAPPPTPAPLADRQSAARLWGFTNSGCFM